MGNMLTIPSHVGHRFLKFVSWDIEMVWRIIRRFERISGGKFGTKTFFCGKDTLRKILREMDLGEVNNIWSGITKQQQEQKIRTDKIDLLTFFSGLFLVCRGEIKRKVRHGFKMFDFDKNGSISKLELTIMFQAMCKGLCQMTGHPTPVSLKRDMEALADKTFDEADTDKNSMLDIEEILKMISTNAEVRLVLSFFSDEKRTRTRRFRRFVSIITSPYKEDQMKLPLIKSRTPPAASAFSRTGTRMMKSDSTPKLPTSANATCSSYGSPKSDDSMKSWKSPKSSPSLRQSSSKFSVLQRASVSFLELMAKHSKKSTTFNSDDLDPDVDVTKEEEDKHKKWLSRLAQKQEGKKGNEKEESDGKTTKKKHLTKPQKLRKFVAGRTFGGKKLAQVNDGIMPYPVLNSLQPLRLKRIYEETANEVQAILENKMVPEQPRYTMKTIVNISLKLKRQKKSDLMESFEDFLLMLYAENEAVDEKEIDEIIKHADLYTVDEKFIEEMYNTFLQTDLECSSRVDLHTFIASLAKIQRFIPYTTSIRNYIAQTPKAELKFCPAALHLFIFSKSAMLAASKVFAEGFSMSDGLSSEHLQSYKQSFNRYDADKDGKITMIEMENHLMGLKSLVKGKEEVRQMFREMDTNGDGEIDLPEFIFFHRQFDDGAPRYTVSKSRLEKLLFELQKKGKAYQRKAKLEKRIQREAAKQAR